MTILSNLSVRYKVLVILTVPIVGLLLFSINSVLDKNAAAREMASVQTLAALSVRISALVHEIQKERGMTAGYLGSNGEQFASEIVAQRNDTDGQISKLESYLGDFGTSDFGSAFSGALSGALGHIQQLDSRRRQISSMSISTPEAIDYYTSMNRALLNVIGMVIKMSSNGDVARMMDAYLNFLQGKERAGIERAVLANTFARDEFAAGMFVKFTTLVAMQQAYLDNFSVLATDEAVGYFNETMRAPEVAEVDRMREAAFNKASMGGFGVDAREWFDTVTVKINLLKEVENNLSQELVARAAALRREALAALTLFAILTVVAGAVAIAMGLLVARVITRALSSAVEALNDIADGEGDLTRRLDDSARDEIGQLAGAFNRFAGKIREMLIEIRQASLSINASSSEIAAGNLDLSSRTEEQSSSLEETAASMEELTSTVRQTADNAMQADQLASSARDQADRGGGIVAGAVVAMEEIRTSSQRIANIIGVIDEIAFQTNLLALNASVEAARAGEHGRGFAVVASEVRSLAQRTAAEAREIRGLIEDSVGRVEEGSRLVNQSGESLSSIMEAIARVSEIVAEITAAASEQSRGIEQVNQAVTQLDEMTQQNAALVEEASASSISLDEQAAGMAGLVSRFVIDEAGSASVEPQKARPGVSIGLRSARNAVPRTPPARSGLRAVAD